jgi:hypothetical protein
MSTVLDILSFCPVKKQSRVGTGILIITHKRAGTPQEWQARGLESSRF